VLIRSLRVKGATQTRVHRDAGKANGFVHGPPDRRRFEEHTGAYVLGEGETYAEGWGESRPSAGRPALRGGNQSQKPYGMAEALPFQSERKHKVHGSFVGSRSRANDSAASG